MKNHILGGLALILAAVAAPTAVEAMTLTADCGVDASNALGNALAAAAPFDVIEVNGTCTQNVTILIDDLTIQGVGGNPTVAGELFVNGARRVTIQNLAVQGSGTPGLNGIVSINSAAVRIANVTIDGIGDHGVIVLHGASADLDHVTVRNSTRGIVTEDNGSFQVVNSLVETTSDIAIVINRQSSGVVIDTTVQNNGGIGILFALGGGGNVINSTIHDNAGVGVIVTTGADAALGGLIIENNGGIGIDISQGSNGEVTNSTIQNNGEIGIHVGYSSTAQIQDNPIIQATAIPVSVDFGASALLRNNVVTATETDDAALDMDWGATVRLAGGNTLNASPIGYSIFLQQGSTLNQRSQLDTVNGPVWVRSASNAEFRKVHITGNVQTEDHSLVRFRELTNDGNVAVTGNMSVSRDSGLNFVGGLPVRVIGNITCADQESSLGTDNLVLTGSKKSCTGYNNQNVQN